jgi:cyclopropane fatty-acyl-phospholipid synthase-like methyltransferase
LCRFDEDYFEHGVEKGISLYENYHWMPERSFKEALAIIDFLGLDKSSYILDVGCSKGFLVKAFREIGIKTDGCDISTYALSFSPDGCWDCSDESSWDNHYNCGYSHIIIKDMLEHLTKDQLPIMLKNFHKVSSNILCIVPMGNDGKYIIPEYHTDKTHIIAEDKYWWMGQFLKEKWRVMDHVDYIVGVKDNWRHIPQGNHVFLLKSRKEY